MPFPVGDLLKNRDPEGTNSHLLVQFEDAMGEPEAAHSNDCVWQLSYRCFEIPKFCIYKLLSVFCGCCCAFAWSFQFGIIAFLHVWCFTPLTNYCGVWAHCIKGHFGACYQCCCGPIAELSSLFFNNIGVYTNTHRSILVTPMGSRHGTTVSKV